MAPWNSLEFPLRIEFGLRKLIPRARTLSTGRISEHLAQARHRITAINIYRMAEADIPGGADRAKLIDE